MSRQQVRLSCEENTLFPQLSLDFSMPLLHFSDSAMVGQRRDVALSVFRSLGSWPWRVSFLFQPCLFCAAGPRYLDCSTWNTRSVMARHSNLSYAVFRVDGRKARPCVDRLCPVGELRLSYKAVFRNRSYI